MEHPLGSLSDTLSVSLGLRRIIVFLGLILEILGDFVRLWVSIVLSLVVRSRLFWDGGHRGVLAVGCWCGLLREEILERTKLIDDPRLLSLVG